MCQKYFKIECINHLLLSYKNEHLLLQQNCRKESLNPGSEGDLKISATIVNSDTSLRIIQPHKRNCYFDGERKLKLFKVILPKDTISKYPYMIIL